MTLIYPYTKEKIVPVPRRGEIMRDETKMDVYTSGVTGAEYDAGMKQLMSNKEIIVPILQMTVPEFKTCSQEEILQCLDISSITKDDFVSDILKHKENRVKLQFAFRTVSFIHSS